MRKVHILEGRASDRTLIFACGRRSTSIRSTYVGGANYRLGRFRHAVDCVLCLRKYGAGEAPSATRTGEK